MRVINRIGLYLAIALVICLFPMPYGYYSLIRFVTMVFLMCLAFVFHKEGKVKLSVIAAATALLFQPFFKIALGRIMWNIMDAIVAFWLILLWYHSKKASV